MSNRIFGCALLGLAAFFLAHGVGLPGWTSWHIGDASDVGFCVFVGLLHITGRRP